MTFAITLTGYQQRCKGLIAQRIPRRFSASVSALRHGSGGGVKPDGMPGRLPLTCITTPPCVDNDGEAALTTTCPGESPQRQPPVDAERRPPINWRQHDPCRLKCLGAKTAQGFFIARGLPGGHLLPSIRSPHALQTQPQIPQIWEALLQQTLEPLPPG